MPETTSCPFCQLASSRMVKENAHGVVIRDAFPVALGHSLIVSRRHVGSFFELTSGERLDLMTLVEDAKLELDEQYCPSGYNVGFNDGPAAGQTVPHVHIHLIPRYAGDCIDPRGGIRWVLPDKAKYWL
ncbi:HIT family protein [Roseateles oligotrophus]|uniref:HIT family protein n=1 Tax=Roseateles oligotrophus TaxID=1769250 RepID=A0ABT2YCB5_9BURK|nr:HIT family protein [Roseateles oligotrophus]MCV2367680.1 HIT family protein [Roseateles oligotrophus]